MRIPGMEAGMGQGGGNPSVTPVAVTNAVAATCLILMFEHIPRGCLSVYSCVNLDHQRLASLVTLGAEG